MAALPYMPLYVADYLADAAHLTTEEHGAYLLLIMNYWQRGKALPCDPLKLSRIARLSNERWTDVERTLNEFFEVRDGCWYHERIEDELLAANAKIDRARAAGKASAAKKHNASSTDVEQPLNASSTDVEQSANSPDKTKLDKTKGSKRNTTPPDGGAFALPEWIPSDAWAGFVEMRQRTRAALTSRAKQLAVIELTKLRAKGHDPGAVLDQSTQNSWRGLFEIKIEGSKNGKPSEQSKSRAQRVAERLDEIARKDIERNGLPDYVDGCIDS